MLVRKRGLIALLTALMLVLAACSGDTGDTGAPTTAAGGGDTTTTAAGGGGDTTTTAASGGDDLAGTRVTVFGPESSEEEAGAMQDALDVFAAQSGIEIVYTGARDFSDQINAQAAGGNPPDLAVFPQPGKVGDFAREGFLLPVPDDVVAAVEDQWGPGWFGFGEVEGTQYALPNKSDLKSLVWYNTSIFADGGYSIPETWDDLMSLTDQMIADGVTPWCVGIESGPATGWPFTDWIEDLMLRFHGADVYDQWVAHEIAFDDPRVVEVGETVIELWNKPGAVFAAGGSVAATPFGDNGIPLAEGDCAMHRQASFFAAFLPEGASVGPGGDIDVFYLPPVDPANRPTLVAGTVVGAFRDAPEVWAVLEYLASAEYSTERQRAQAARKGGGQSGYLSANLEQDLSVYNDLERTFVEILQTGDPARFDGSDLMPAAVGANSFWTEGTEAVAGNTSVEEAFAAIEASWPTE